MQRHEHVERIELIQFCKHFPPFFSGVRLSKCEEQVTTLIKELMRQLVAAGDIPAAFSVLHTASAREAIGQLSFLFFCLHLLSQLTVFYFISCIWNLSQDSYICSVQKLSLNFLLLFSSDSLSRWSHKLGIGNLTLGTWIHIQSTYVFLSSWIVTQHGKTRLKCKIFFFHFFAFFKDLKYVS